MDRQTTVLQGWSEFKELASDFMCEGPHEIFHISAESLLRTQEMAYYAGAHRAGLLAYGAAGQEVEEEGRRVRAYNEADLQAVVMAIQAVLRETLEKAQEFRQEMDKVERARREKLN